MAAKIKMKGYVPNYARVVTVVRLTKKRVAYIC